MGKLWTMGKVYKDKKSGGCALCKPHKHGWAPKKKARVMDIEKNMDREIADTFADSKNREHVKLQCMRQSKRT